MVKHLVRYNNNLHSVSLAGMTTKERSLFFAMCCLLKEKGTNDIVLTFDQLKELSKFSSSSIQLFIETLKNTYKKLINLTFHQETEDKIIEFVLFTKYEINKKKKEITIKVNEDFKYILNHLENNYTEHEMLEYSSLKSDYSQLTYALLKKWETTKKVEISLEKYKKILAIPESYSTTNFNKRVLNQILSELPQYFQGLEIEKIKTGRKVTDLKFTWKYKKSSVMLMPDIEIKISEKLHKALEKARKNRYIEHLLTVENIEKLLQKYDEKVLIKGLNTCYKEINKQIKSLNYIIKTIETVATKKNKKIVVEKDVSEEQVEVLSVIQESEIVQESEMKVKEKVLQKEYDSLYRMYLEKNKVEHNQFIEKAFSIRYEIVDKINLSKRLLDLIEKYEISDNEILAGISDYHTREKSIEKIAENREENKEENKVIVDKEYEEFLAWKKWKEEMEKNKR